MTAVKPQLLELDLSKLQPAKDNLRQELGDVAELAESMKDGVGVLEPIIATPENGHYKIVAGHRRFAAAKLAGLTVVPVIVREFDEQTRVAAMLIENLQHEELSPLEEAAGYRRLVDEFKLTQTEIAQRVGRGQGHISKRLALLELPKPIQAKVDSGGIAIADAVELAKLKDEPKALTEIARHGYGIANSVQAHIERTKREAQHREAIASAKRAGIKILSPTKDRWRQYQLPKGTVEISKSGGYYALTIDPAQHAKEPCHAIVDMPGSGHSQPRLIFVCTNRKNHPNAKTGQQRDRVSMTSHAPNAAEKRARELTKIAKPRREFAGTVAKAGLPAHEHATLVLDTLIESAHSEVLKLACRMLGLETDAKGNTIRDYGKQLREHAGKSHANRGRVELAIAFGTHEESLTGPWNGWSDHVPYLNLLQQHGYEISAAERQKAGKGLAAAPKKPATRRAAA